MARTIAESKAVRDSLAGHNAAAPVPIPELIAITAGDVRERFASLENDEQRQGFLDSITAKLNGNWGNWAKFYEAVAIIREQETYWKRKGYDSFESFWRAMAGPAFQSFKELESIYNFAKTACPELFGIDFEGAKHLRKQLQALVAVPVLGANGIQRAKKRYYSGKEEARAAVVVANTWYNPGGKSLEYRLAKLKRDRPDIAARVLAGEFFRTLGTGLIGIDMAAAEREAYGEPKQKSQPVKTTVGLNVAKMIRSAAKSHVSRQQIIEKLREIPWLMDALAGAPGKKKR